VIGLVRKERTRRIIKERHIVTSIESERRVEESVKHCSEIEQSHWRLVAPAVH
jgi:hypothetical protein